ncbi:MAG: hypothetical protein VKI42_01740 [Synechococcaceae cyanobacterium]|nr:hypothetical protein [Synechococcaceae cyanobacterium]
MLRSLRQPAPRHAFPACPTAPLRPKAWLAGARPRLRQRGLLRSSLRPLLTLSILLSAAPGPAGDSLARCHAWQRSHGVKRILLGNAIGATNHLTKRQKLLESPADAPIALYQDSDLQRVCSLR